MPLFRKLSRNSRDICKAHERFLSGCQLKRPESPPSPEMRSPPSPDGKKPKYPCAFSLLYFLPSSTQTLIALPTASPVKEQAITLPGRLTTELLDRQLSESDIVISKKLGHGASAKVYKAYYENFRSENSFAIKVFNKHPGLDRGAPEKEFKLLRKLANHPNVLNAYQFIVGKGKLKIPRNIKRNEYDTFHEYRTGLETIEKP